MEGEFIVKIGKKLFEYTNINDIPEKFDHLIKFVPTVPPEPHSEEEHKLINSFMIKFKEIQKRGIKDNG
tara:strand:- start:235 stop:441 length:207 start_codon:yes stop_codon:yes gene_type:complete